MLMDKWRGEKTNDRDAECISEAVMSKNKQMIE